MIKKKVNDIKKTRILRINVYLHCKLLDKEDENAQVNDGNGHANEAVRQDELGHLGCIILVHQ